MSKTPPSEEAFLEVFQVVERVLARPGERVTGLAVFVLTDGPDGDMVRATISPADAQKAVLRIIRRRIDEVIDE